MLLYLILTTLLFLPSTEQARILCFYPTPSKSGVLMAQPLMVELAKKGHEVTVVSPFGLPESVNNYRDVVIPVGSAASGNFVRASYINNVT